MNVTLKVKRIYCKVRGHKYAIVKTYHTHARQLKCENCEKKVLKEENGHVIPFSLRLHDAYKELERYHLKKQKRRQMVTLK